MKKALSIILAVVVVMCALPFSLTASAATSGTTGDCTWTLNGTTLTISGNGKMGDYDYWSYEFAPWGRSITIVTIEEGVASIGDYAFWGCTRLTSINIPNSVTSIGKGAFEYCTGLISITIPNSVTSIGWCAFSHCTGLTSITVEEGNTVFHSKNNCLIETESKTLILGCKNSIIPTDGSVTSIGDYAFGYCTGLTSITIPDSVTSIGERAFYECTGLTSITIPNSVTSIGYGAFEFCTGLTSITIPNSVTSIGRYAFSDCTGLENVWYSGSINDRNNIEIDRWNYDLLNATWHYNTCNIDDHVYSSDCDENCNNCEWVRTSVAEHVYSSECDANCNDCGGGREAKADHTYDYICSNECNSCGAVRETVHTYDNSCDTNCNICGGIREITHNFEWIIDQQENCGVNGIKHQECIVCGATASENTSIPAIRNHTYENSCDTTCNVCGGIREITHNFEWIIDQQENCGVNGIKHQKCTVCGVTANENTSISATGNHTYTNKVDAECNVCGYFREIKPDYAITTDDTILIDFSHQQDHNIILSDNSIAEISDLNSSVKIVNGVVTKVTQATISPLKTGYVLIQVISDSGEVLSETVLLITEGKKKSYGNVDGNDKIDATDSLLILQASVGKIQFTDAQKTAADVNGDGTLTAYDALLTLQYSVGKITKFPVEG